MKRIVILLALVIVLLLAGRALAMSSPNYRLDWFTPLTGGGGGSANSAQYDAGFTVGQSAIGASASTGYQVCLGYWCGLVEAEGVVPYHQIHLPFVLRK